MKLRTTLQEWQQVGTSTSNAIAHHCAMLEHKARAVVAGHERMMIATSPSGVGKSYIVRRAAPNAIISNPVNYSQLLKSFEEAGKQPILMEEGNFALRSERVLNILKIAADPVWKNRTYEETRLDAPIFILCNQDFEKPPTPTLAEHWRALFRRSPPVIIPDDREMLWEYSCYLAIAKGMLKKTLKGQQISRQVADDSLDFFTRNLWKLTNVSPATLVEIARINTVNADPYRSFELGRLLGEPVANRPVPASPVIQVK